MSRRPPPALRLARGLGIAYIPHLDDVYARVVRASGRGEPDAVALRLVAVVHEQPPAVVSSLLRRHVGAAVAARVAAIVRGFGEIWKIDDERALARYVRRHRAHLRALLLFELAHEGTSTEAMRRAAVLGGLTRPLAAWTRRLTSMDRAAPAVSSVG